jgi:ankyrin repeat protein
MLISPSYLFPFFLIYNITPTGALSSVGRYYKTASVEMNYFYDDILDAAALGDLRRVQELQRERPERITERDGYERTALILAARAGQLKTVKWLLREGGSTIREADHRGWTAMLSAALFGRLATVAWLLEHGGADIGDVDNDGATY